MICVNLNLVVNWEYRFYNKHWKKKTAQKTELGSIWIFHKRRYELLKQCTTKRGEDFLLQ